MWKVGQRVNINFLENQEFIVVKHLEGGMGDVYKVVGPSLVKSLAIKTLKKSMSASAFKQECEIVFTTSLHRSCIKPVGYGIIDAHPAIAYHWHHSSLADHNYKNWNTEEIENLLIDLMSFFHYACNDINILHCDIKPSNILVDDKKKPFVTDFGISKMIGSESFETFRAVAGTREYMAPELQFTGTQSVKSEIYSFGISIYEFLTGEHPYLNKLSTEANTKILSNNFKALRKRLGSSMTEYLDYIERSICIEPAKRPDSFGLIAASIRPQQERADRTLIDSICMQASYQRKEKSYAKSEQILLDALRSHGKHPALLNALGNTYSLSKSREHAIVPYEEASDIVMASDGFSDSMLYLDPIMNLSIQYRCMNRFQDAAKILNRAWAIVEMQDRIPFMYAEFGWLMVYEGKFIQACSYMGECFENRKIQPFEMYCFAEAAWLSGQIEKYADLILSNVIYNIQFNEAYFLCAFLLSRYASTHAIDRMHSMLSEEVKRSIENVERQSDLPIESMRPPKDKRIQELVMLGIDHVVTGGKYKYLFELD